jgi:hypothetical protein
LKRLAPSRLSALLPALLISAMPAALAQVGDVVQPSASGDFLESQSEGPRGRRPQRLWLVVDRDPAGLLCRDADGRALLALRRGALLEADSGPGLPSALQMRGGRSYLRLRVKPVDILSERRRMPHSAGSICQVRAHGAYIAPVLLDSLLALPAAVRMD